MKKRLLLLLLPVLVFCSCAAPKQINEKIPSEKSESQISSKVIGEGITDTIEDTENVQEGNDVKDIVETETIKNVTDSVDSKNTNLQEESRLKKPEKEIKPTVPKPAPTSQPTSTPDPKPEIVEKTSNPITISITGDDNIIIKKVSTELKSDQTVFDVLMEVTRENKIHMDFSGSHTSPYVKGINNLYEFDKGPMSGWTYKVNGVSPNVSAGSYKLEPGDVIEWIYTTDLSKS